MMINDDVSDCLLVCIMCLYWFWIMINYQWLNDVVTCENIPTIYCERILMFHNGHRWLLMMTMTWLRFYESLCFFKLVGAPDYPLCCFKQPRMERVLNLGTTRFGKRIFQKDTNLVRWLIPLRKQVTWVAPSFKSGDPDLVRGEISPNLTSHVYRELCPVPSSLPRCAIFCRRILGFSSSPKPLPEIQSV